MSKEDISFEPGDILIAKERATNIVDQWVTHVYMVKGTSLRPESDPQGGEPLQIHVVDLKILYSSPNILLPCYNPRDFIGHEEIKEPVERIADSICSNKKNQSLFYFTDLIKKPTSDFGDTNA